MDTVASDVQITYLPNEILEHILQDVTLTAQDVCNFGSSCSKFRNLVNNSNKLWKTKLIQRFPKLHEAFDLQKQYCWRDKYWKRKMFGEIVLEMLGNMSSKFHRKEEISNSELQEYGDLMEEYEDGYAFMIHELQSIIFDVDLSTNITRRYYAEKVIRYVRQVHLREEWHKFIAQDPEDQLLEKGAVIVSQWCQPTIDVPYEHIAQQLDSIVTNVREQLHMTHNKHPLFRASEEELQRWRVKNISDNQWRPVESEQILSAICKVLFQDMGFHGNIEMYYSASNSFIDKVLELRKGIPITLSIVFESVARRLGVKCEPVSFPAHFLLRWKERYNTDPSEPSPYYYIDVFNGGQFLTKRSCPRYSRDTPCPMGGMRINPATPVQVIERMANNLEVAGRQRTQMNGRGARLRSALELLNLINPVDMNCILQLARFYMLYSMNLSDLTTSILKLQDELEPRAREQAKHILQMLQVYEMHHYKDTSKDIPQIEPKFRSDNVTFAVGMIMHHRQYNYKCVIYGWDPLCAASQDWIRQMGVDSLPNKSHQPFYNVLVQDGSTRYAAQDNLEIATVATVVNHLEVGRYFDTYSETHYIPNAEKEAEYPEDAEVRTRLVKSFYTTLLVPASEEPMEEGVITV